MKHKQVYWLSDAEWSAIEPHLPRGRSGAPRVDDRRIVSGIVHMLRSGARWRDCPAEYGPYTTVYNRFKRWSRQGGWSGIFYALTGKNDVVTGAIDATYVKAQRSTAGAKGGFRQRHWCFSRRTNDQNPCADRRSRPTQGFGSDGGQYPRSGRGGGSAQARANASQASCRSSLRRSKTT